MADVCGVRFGKMNSLFWNRQKSWAGMVAFMIFGTLFSLVLLELAGTFGVIATWPGGSGLAAASLGAGKPRCFLLDSGGS